MIVVKACTVGNDALPDGLFDQMDPEAPLNLRHHHLFNQLMMATSDQPDGSETIFVMHVIVGVVEKDVGLDLAEVVVGLVAHGAGILAIYPQN